MKKLHQIALFFLFAISLNAHAATHTIQVGVSSGLTFTPNTNTTVNIGDIIRWVWVSGTHTTTSVTVPSGAATWTSNISSTTTSFEYTVTTAGTYDYKCNPHGTSGMTGSFTVAGTTPIFDKTSLVYTSFELSPNPAAESVTMKFSAEKSFKANLFVFDGNGREKISKKIEIIQGENNYSFNVSNLPKGVYYLTVAEGSNYFISKKFVKE